MLIDSNINGRPNQCVAKHGLMCHYAGAAKREGAKGLKHPPQSTKAEPETTVYNFPDSV